MPSVLPARSEKLTAGHRLDEPAAIAFEHDVQVCDRQQRRHAHS